MKQDIISVDFLREIFLLKPDGSLVWRTREEITSADARHNKLFAGKVAGTRMKHGHIIVKITVDGLQFGVLAHRIVWALSNGAWPAPDATIDHVNGDASDNRPVNLRECRQEMNVKNRKLGRNSSTGYKGVRRLLGYDRWFAVLGGASNRIMLGTFDSPEEAARAYDTAAIAHYGEFAKTNASLGLLS